MGRAIGRLLLCAWAGLALWMPEASAYIEPVDGVTHFEETVAYDGRNRHALYFRPTAASTTRAPLLVLLHYRGGDGEAMNYLTQASLLVRDFGIWVVLPDAKNQNWNHDPADTGRVDDVAWLSHLIDSAVARFPVDGKKVTMAGLSDGGFMAMRFACERPQKVAAVAAVAATFLKKLERVCQPSLGTPFLMINGTGDERTKYDSTWGVLTVPASAARWAQIDGCPTGPKRTVLPDIAADRTTVVLDTWAACAAGEVRLYTVENGGHTWPGARRDTLMYGRTSHDFDATLTIWQFLRRFSR
ncbi:MAG TPA: PHB depolymerase family esterase [Nevskiaceae bacterium]|nr:PHB depolymerase family esterase [Nevskiaceae bacterium]